MRLTAMCVLLVLLAGARADVRCKPENCSGKLPQILLNRTLLPKTAQTVLLDRGTYIWNTSTQNGNFDRSKNENPPPGWGSVMGAVIAGDRGTATQDPDPNSWAVTIQGKQLEGRDECKNETDIGTIIDAQGVNAMFYLFGAQTLNLQCVRLVNGTGPLSGGVLINCTNGCNLHFTHAEFQGMKYAQTNKSYENLTASVINIVDEKSKITDDNRLYREDVIQNETNMLPVCSNHAADYYDGLFCDRQKPVRPLPKDDDDDDDDDADDDGDGQHKHKHHKSPAGLIGGVVGGVVLVGLLAGLVMYRRRRMRDHFSAGGGAAVGGAKTGAGRTLATAVDPAPVAVVVSSTTVKGDDDKLAEPLLTQNQPAAADAGAGGGAGEPASGWY